MTHNNIKPMLKHKETMVYRVQNKIINDYNLKNT